MKFETKNLAEIRKMAEDLLVQMECGETAEIRKEAADNLDETIAYYATVSKNATYEKVKKAENPMHAAVLEFFYPVIRVKEVKDKETDAICTKIVDADRPIDLADLHGKFKIGANHKWVYMAQQLNYQLSLRAAERLGSDAAKKFLEHKDSFHMADLARQVNLGKNPCSNTQLLNTLKLVIGAMLGEGEGLSPLSYDVNYLVDVYATDNKKSKTSVSAANHKTLIGYLKKVCYRILTKSKGYVVEQREYKEN